MKLFEKIKRKREIKRLSLEISDLEWQSFANENNDDFDHESLNISLLAKRARITVLKNAIAIEKGNHPLSLKTDDQ